MLPVLGRAAVTWPHVDTPTSKGSKQATMDLVKMPLEMTKPTGSELRPGSLEQSWTGLR